MEIKNSLQRELAMDDLKTLVAAIERFDAKVAQQTKKKEKDTYFSSHGFYQEHVKGSMEQPDLYVAHIGRW